MSTAEALSLSPTLQAPATEAPAGEPEPEPEPLDVLGVAGGAAYKRLVPLVVAWSSWRWSSSGPSSHSGRRPGALLAGVDRAAFAAALAVRLRRHGVPVGFTGVEDFTHALAIAPPGTLPELYWTARINLVRRQSEIEPFDEVFAAVFQATGPALDPARPAQTPQRGERRRSDERFAPLPARFPRGRRPRRAALDDAACGGRDRRGFGRPGCSGTVAE